MKIGVIPENIAEWFALALGHVPTPIIEVHSNLTFVRALMVATKLNLFEALASEALTAQEVATRCGTHPEATQRLLSALMGMSYLRQNRERYVLAPVARKWLLKEIPQSIHDLMVYEFLEWEWLTHLEGFIRTGKSVQMHDQMSKNDWKLYQHGMQSMASVFAPEVAECTPVPRGACNMLDIGGSHGCYSIELCRRYPDLHAVILDLPEAVEYAAPLVAKAGMGNRVVHKAGNVLTEDFGTDAYDLIFISNLVHHFDDTTNRDLVRRAARSLKPGAYLVIQEVAIRPRSSNKGAQALGRLDDLFFALISGAGTGTWKIEEIVSWQREAGLIPKKPIKLKTSPVGAQQVAMKPLR